MQDGPEGCGEDREQDFHINQGISHAHCPSAQKRGGGGQTRWLPRHARNKFHKFERKNIFAQESNWNDYIYTGTVNL